MHTSPCVSHFSKIKPEFYSAFLFTKTPIKFGVKRVLCGLARLIIGHAPAKLPQCRDTAQPLPSTHQALWLYHKNHCVSILFFDFLLLFFTINRLLTIGIFKGIFLTKKGIILYFFFFFYILFLTFFGFMIDIYDSLWYNSPRNLLEQRRNKKSYESYRCCKTGRLSRKNSSSHRDQKEHGH